MVGVIDSLFQGLNKPIMLWLLAKRPLHGYGLIKELRKITGRRLKPSIVYMFLYWLEEEGFVKWTKTEYRGRERKYYSLTEKGEELLDSLRKLFQRHLGDILSEILLGE